MWNRSQLVADRGAKKAPDVPNVVGVSRIGVQGRPPYPQIDPRTLARTFAQNELAFACVDIRATAAGDPTLQIETRGNDGSYSATPAHPLRRLLIRPNSHQDEASFMRACVASMDVAGVLYLERLESGAGGLVGLNPLNPASVKAVMLGTDDLRYRWQEHGQTVDFRPEELIIRRGDWTRPPRMAVALGTIDADNGQTDFVRSFFDNGGVPSGRIKVKGTISTEKADGIRARWRTMFGRAGGGRAHDVAVFDDNGDYEKIGANLDELESEILRSVSESRICMAFGVPPLIIYAYSGLLRATYSNLKEAWRGFWDATMSPLLKDWRMWATWTLLSEFEPMERILSEQVRLGWDLSQVAALQDDVDQAQKRARDAFTAGGMTLNELRAVLRLPADTAGDYYLRSKVLLANPAGELPLPPPTLIGFNGPAKARGAKATPQASIERKMEKAVAKYLASEYDKAAAALT